MPNGGKVKLTNAPLTAPNAVLSRPDASGVRLLNDIVFAGKQLQFPSDSEAVEYAIAGSTLKFQIADNQTFALVHNGRQGLLQRDQSGFRPVKLKLDQNRVYTLAFPYGYVTQMMLGVGQAQRTQGLLMLRSGSGQYFTLDGQSFCLFDSNADGYYRLSEDAIGSGRSGASCSVFAPIGRLLATSKNVYQINSIAEDGSTLDYAPYTGATGKLAVNLANSDLEIGAAFGSSDGALNFAAPFSRTRAHDLKVAAGKYSLLYGLAYSPGHRKIVASVGSGKLAAADVSADQSQKLTLGGPFDLEFALQTGGRQMTISSSSFHLRGKNGEEYANFQWDAEPEIGLAVNGNLRSLGKMAFG